MKVYTRRLAAAVALACREMMSIKSIAGQFNLHWGTVKTMDKEALKSEREERRGQAWALFKTFLFGK